LWARFAVGGTRCGKYFHTCADRGALFGVDAVEQLPKGAHGAGVLLAEGDVAIHHVERLVADLGEVVGEVGFQVKGGEACADGHDEFE